VFALQASATRAPLDADVAKNADDEAEAALGAGEGGKLKIRLLARAASNRSAGHKGSPREGAALAHGKPVDDEEDDGPDGNAVVALPDGNAVVTLQAGEEPDGKVEAWGSGGDKAGREVAAAGGALPLDNDDAGSDGDKSAMSSVSSAVGAEYKRGKRKKCVGRGRPGLVG
jgi:hypothetical protein